MATDSLSVRFRPTAAALVAILAGCAVASPSPSAAPTNSPAQTEEASASASSAGGPVACADVFSATDGRIAFTIGLFDGPKGIATINADGSGFQRILERMPGQPNGGTEAPRWTPDGHILFDSNRAGGPDDWHIFVMDADGGNLVQLTSGSDGIENYPVLSADGSTLVFEKYLPTPGGWGGGGIFASDADGSNERQVTMVPEGVTPEFPEGAVDEWPDISPDGKQIVFGRGATPTEGGLYVVNIDGTGLRRIIEGEFQAHRPRWSPDGKWIVFHNNSERFLTESSNVWVIAPDGTGLRQLTHESVPGQAWAADWSPDGEHIVLFDTGLDVIGLDGSLTCDLYSAGGAATGFYPDWGP